MTTVAIKGKRAQLSVENMKYLAAARVPFKGSKRDSSKGKTLYDSFLRGEFLTA